MHFTWMVFRPQFQLKKKALLDDNANNAEKGRKASNLVKFSGLSDNDAYRLPRPFGYHPSFVWSFLIHFISRLSWRSPRSLAKSEDTLTWQSIRIISTIIFYGCTRYNISYNSRKTMHKKGASSVSKPIVVDLDGRPVTPADDEEFMMMSDAIMDDNDGLKSPSNAHSQIRITDDLRGHTVAPRRARSTFADGELRRQSRLDVAKTSKPMPVVKPVAPTTPVAAPAPNVQKNAVTSSVKTAKPNPPKLPTASPELALARGPSPTNPVTPTSGGTPQSNNTCNTCVLHVILKKEKTTAKVIVNMIELIGLLRSVLDLQFTSSMAHCTAAAQATVIPIGIDHRWPVVLHQPRRCAARNRSMGE
ncbi:hypothetical protein Y032_0071g532 [Ancylostoma ceylanicum]|uniref:Uncharacterized protein n=2 Tax=Ancylostoma ceylanicum TaxID=53326 RepID=A0A016TXX9_9BILA|nr:hypothetical protein Y032_0071g532 [Ancylostoma ceylanicum]